MPSKTELHAIIEKLEKQLSLHAELERVLEEATIYVEDADGNLRRLRPIPAQPADDPMPHALD